MRQMVLFKRKVGLLTKNATAGLHNEKRDWWQATDRTAKMKS